MSAVTRSALPDPVFLGRARPWRRLAAAGFEATWDDDVPGYGGSCTADAAGSRVKLLASP